MDSGYFVPANLLSMDLLELDDYLLELFEFFIYISSLKLEVPIPLEKRVT